MSAVEFDLLNAASLTDIFASVVRVCGDTNDNDATLEAARPAKIKYIRGIMFPMPRQSKRPRKGVLSSEDF